MPARLVSQEIRHLNRLVSDLIEISRFDAGTAQLVAEDTDIAATVTSCLRVRNWTGVVSDVPAGLSVRLNVLISSTLPRTRSIGLPLDPKLAPINVLGKEMPVEIEP